jgi:hypothetical protein
LLKTTNVSGTISVTITIALMMRTEIVPETLVVFNELTRQTAKEKTVLMSVTVKA